MSTTNQDQDQVLATFHANNIEAQSRFSGHDIFVVNGRGGRGVRGRSNNRNNDNGNERSEVKPICFNCGRDGHKSNNCRHPAVSKEDQDIAKAVAHQRKETVSKSGGPSGKK